MNSFLWKCLSHCSDSQLSFLEKITKKNGIIEKIDSDKLREYIYNTDFETLDISNRKICVIDALDWDFPFFTFYFFNNVIANIAYCLYKGYLPYVNYVSPNRRINLWEEFMVQPYHSKMINNNEQVNCKYRFAPIYFPNFPSEKEISSFSNLYYFFKPNEATKTYFATEHKKLIMGKRVLGVLYRGTDYTDSWISGLPKQPSIENLIKIVSKELIDLNCDYIYLATEEKSAYIQFNQAFPEKIITNKREYYDDRYYMLRNTNSKHLLISNISNNRPNDDHYKYLEYLSSINLLSKCNALIAGSCGGSRAALYLNRGKYEYSKLVDLGTFK